MMHFTTIAQMVQFPPNKEATRAQDKKCLLTKSPHNSLVLIQNDFTEFFLMMHPTKLAQMVPIY